MFAIPVSLTTFPMLPFIRVALGVFFALNVLKRLAFNMERARVKDMRGLIGLATSLSKRGKVNG
jgi:hypothetical protein